MLGSANAAGLRDHQLKEMFLGWDGSSSEGVLRRFRVAMTRAGMRDGCLGRRISDVDKEGMGIEALENVEGDERGWCEVVRDAVEIDREGVEGVVPGFLPTDRRGGFVRSLLEEGEKRGNGICVLVRFVNEGDNAGDAAVMADVAAAAVGAGKESGEAGGDAQVVGKVAGRWNVPVGWVDDVAPPDGLY